MSYNPHLNSKWLLGGGECHHACSEGGRLSPHASDGSVNKVGDHTVLNHT